MIAFLGFPKTFKPHVLFAVNVFYIREFLGNSPYEFTVNHSICAFNTRKSLLKMHIHGELVELSSSSEGNRFTILI